VTLATVPRSTKLIDESLHFGFLFGLGERLVKSSELVGEHGEGGGRRVFFLGYSQTTTFCLGFLYFIFYYNMGILVTLTLKR
jgi:hypothetical protein